MQSACNISKPANPPFLYFTHFAIYAPLRKNAVIFAFLSQIHKFLLYYIIKKLDMSRNYVESIQKKEYFFMYFYQSLFMGYLVFLLILFLENKDTPF